MSPKTHPNRSSPSSKPVLDIDPRDIDGSLSSTSKNPLENRAIHEELKNILDIPISRLDIDHEDTDLTEDDWNNYSEVNSTIANVSLHIETSTGEIGSWMALRKVNAGNQVTVTVTAPDVIQGKNKLVSANRILHIMRVSATLIRLTGGED